MEGRVSRRPRYVSDVVGEVSPQLSIGWRVYVTPSSAALECGKDVSQSARHDGHVPVVDGATVQLAAKLEQGVTPVGMARHLHGRGRDGDDDRPFDDLDGCPAGLGRALLLPCPLPAGG